MRVRKAALFVSEAKLNVFILFFSNKMATKGPAEWRKKIIKKLCGNSATSRTYIFYCTIFPFLQHCVFVLYKEYNGRQGQVKNILLSEDFPVKFEKSYTRVIGQAYFNCLISWYYNLVTSFNKIVIFVLVCTSREHQFVRRP